MTSLSGQTAPCTCACWDWRYYCYTSVFSLTRRGRAKVEAVSKTSQLKYSLASSSLIYMYVTLVL